MSIGVKNITEQFASFTALTMSTSRFLPANWSLYLDLRAQARPRSCELLPDWKLRMPGRSVRTAMTSPTAVCGKEEWASFFSITPFSGI